MSSHTQSNIVGQSSRLGMHRDGSDLALQTNEYTAESRQNINSPFKTKGAKTSESTSLTAKKPPVSQIADKKMKDRSVQRGQILSNQLLQANKEGQQSSEKLKEPSKYGERVFNSKSPSKKSLQLQQIL